MFQKGRHVHPANPAVLRQSRYGHHAARRARRGLGIPARDVFGAGVGLERYKEKNPKDPTIREKFITCKFADYKEKVIDLLQRVCSVSVETMRIIEQMPK